MIANAQDFVIAKIAVRIKQQFYDISIITNYYYYNNFFLYVLKIGQKVRKPISEAYIIYLRDGLLACKEEL